MKRLVPPAGNAGGEMSRLLSRRFNAFAQFGKIRLQDDGTRQRNCDAIFRQIALTDY
jgi:hypothetical protein